MHQKSQSYDLRFLRYGVRQIKKFVILGHFLPFYLPPNDPKYQNFEKNEKKYMAILSFYTYVCTINEDYMTYGS